MGQETVFHWKSADWRQGRVRRPVLALQTGKLVLEWRVCVCAQEGGGVHGKGVRVRMHLHTRAHSLRAHKG